MNILRPNIINELIVTTSGLVYGLILSVIIVAAAMIIIQRVNSREEFSPLSYIIAIATCALLTYQLSRLIGAYQLSDKIAQAGDIVNAGTSLLGLDSVSSIANEYISEYKSKYLGWFVFRRILWSVIFLGTGIAGIIITSGKGKRHARSRHGRSNRRYRASTRRR